MARAIQYNANKMNNSRLLKPSYKEVEEFITSINTLKGSVTSIEMFDKSIQRKVTEVFNKPTNTLTECENFAVDMLEVHKHMDDEVPLLWKGFQMSPLIFLTVGENIIIILTIVITFSVINSFVL